MTRALHEATRVQRGDPADFSKAALARGYEKGDVQPVKVALGVAAFVAVMFCGLGAAGMVAYVWTGSHLPSTAVAARPEQPPAPLPRLLADPTKERRAIEAEAQRRLRSGPEPIDKAMAHVAERGWGEDAPAPNSADIARDHAQAAP